MWCTRSLTGVHRMLQRHVFTYARFSRHAYSTLTIKRIPALRQPHGLSTRMVYSYARNFRTIVPCRYKSSGRVTLGNVSTELRIPAAAHKVPKAYLPSIHGQTLLQHLKWMMQKDLLGQDMFLIGGPGPLRRRLAFMYLEMTGRESEYISLSRDTTEADLKQRREIKDGTAFYVDQCAVRAAINGRVLVLEGIEKAERNVLPVLNNLLENREMQLEDGRLLVRAAVFDKLLKTHSLDELHSWRLVRVNEDFRVIALGLPVPRYPGNPLDPPLRSRFQARNIGNPSFKEQLDSVLTTHPQLDSSLASEVFSFAHTMTQSEAESLGLTDFPINNLPLLAAVMSEFPDLRGQKVIQRLYPYHLFLSEEGKKAVQCTFEKFDFGKETVIPTSIISVHPSDSPDQASVTLPSGCSFFVKRGKKELLSNDTHYVSTEFQNRLLVDLLQSHAHHDFCLIGPRGCGKSTVVRKFASMLGYHLEPIMLYQDMTSRDLLQQRTTLANGDTAWRPSPLIQAAVYGHIAVLDGLHRINPGTFSVLSSLIMDRELHLADGSCLLRHDVYDDLLLQTGKTDQQLKELGVLRIHPSFRIIALAEPPKLADRSGQWLNAEVLALFLFHHMTPLPIADEVKVVSSLTKADVNEKLCELTEVLRRSADPNCQALAGSLSTRNLLRITRRLAMFPAESLYDAVHNACMSRFLPKLVRQTLDQMMSDLDIKPSASGTPNPEVMMRCSVTGTTLQIGGTSCTIKPPRNQVKVPDTIFYDNPVHISLMESLLKDFLLGEHLLLVGNQGVGKNKVIDRFLQLLGRPREYIQLHRDTTVQTLTLQPTLRDGRIVYNDSPLVKAVREGLILVIDEADKAPTNVTCVLKTLVESGQMHLSDGRKIASDATDVDSVSDLTIAMHPDFRMIVLANRPGFPFLGNDFFSAVGDIFSCHALDNPDVESEIAMLRHYGADVPEEAMRVVVRAFSDLRDMADQGLISYPYSTREVVNIIKHLQLFPKDGLATAVENVFDFDLYNKEMKETIIETMHKHGIPIGILPSSVALAKEYPLPHLQLTASWRVRSLKDNKVELTARRHAMNITGPKEVPVTVVPVNRMSLRGKIFTERLSEWKLPLVGEGSFVCDLATSLATDRHSDQSHDLLHFATVNPVSVLSMRADGISITRFDLDGVFSSGRMRYQPSIKIGMMGASAYDTLLIHEQVGNALVTLNIQSGRVSRLELGGLLSDAADAITRAFSGSGARKPVHRLCTDLAHTPDGIVVSYTVGGNSLSVINIYQSTCDVIDLPLSIVDVRMPARDTWLVKDTTNKYYLLRATSEKNYSIQEISMGDNPQHIVECSGKPLEKSDITALTGSTVSAPNRLFSTPGSYASLALGFPELDEVDVYSIPRTEDIPETVSSIIQRNSYQFVRSLPYHKAPQLLSADAAIHKTVSGYLEVVDPLAGKVRYLPMDGSRGSIYSAWLKTQPGPMIAPLTNDGVVSADSAGYVQLWEVSTAALVSSLQGWSKLIGHHNEHLQITYQSDRVKDLSTPKHGKVDPTGAPHVGGNTWAGGTGGRDTAGLGGIGGPYRLDAGHDVHQVPQAVKDAVPEHIREAAREMGAKAFKERLKQIQMSEYDAEVYDRFSSSVKRQVQSLRIILDSLQAKGKERQWLKNQTHGDLDDGRIIEGLTGEKTIYRRRGERPPELGAPQEKPKRLRLVVDVSGSMYRFNGHDGRLEREMESVCMVMEALERYEAKLKYDVMGHSGEDFSVKLSDPDKPPKNNKQRLQVLQTMHAHSQFCLSGDFTLKATRHAIDQISKEEADERFVIVLSDANLDRYGIPAASLADALTFKPDVNAYVIFIGSLADQADRLVKQLPTGHGFVCMDSAKLPQILQQIFMSTLLK